jgi:hypothetical protein
LTRPPWISITLDVTYDASSDARKAAYAATSSGRPMRPERDLGQQPARELFALECGVQHRRLDQPGADHVRAQPFSAETLRESPS